MESGELTDLIHRLEDGEISLEVGPYDIKDVLERSLEALETERDNIREQNETIGELQRHIATLEDQVEHLEDKLL